MRVPGVGRVVPRRRLKDTRRGEILAMFAKLRHRQYALEQTVPAVAADNVIRDPALLVRELRTHIGKFLRGETLAAVLRSRRQPTHEIGRASCRAGVRRPTLPRMTRH